MGFFLRTYHCGSNSKPMQRFHLPLTLCLVLLTAVVDAQQVRLVTSPFDAGNGTLRNTIA